VGIGDDWHLDDSDVEDLLAWRMSRARSSRIVNHLLGGCGTCVARIRAKLRQARDAPEDVAAYDPALVAAMIQAEIAFRAEQADRRAGAALWAAVRESPPGRRETIVLNSRRYRTAGALEAICREYREAHALWRDPREGLAVAELAVALAERLDATGRSAERLADLRGEALAIAANANRLAGRMREADRLLRRAAEMLSLGSGDLLLRGQLLWYAGSMWLTRRKFKRAALAFGEAEQIYRAVGERHLAARSMVARAEAIGHRHPEQGIRLIRRAIPEIDAARDPHLELAAHHSLAWYLNDAGQGQAARAEVERSAPLYQRSGDAVASLSRAWLEGRIDRSLDELERARRSYERAWAGFEELGMRIHLTMLAIDRAELKLAVGEPVGAIALLADMLLLVESWGIDPETRQVLRLLREAVEAGHCERAAFRQASLAVRRSWATDECRRAGAAEG
jgi:tetratricopeptide (TPR) repeat protein